MKININLNISDLARNQISQLQDKIFLSQQNLVNLQLDRNIIIIIINKIFTTPGKVHE